jgi:hypothetical protein
VGVVTVAQFEAGDVAGLVGDEDLVTQAFVLVEHAELRAGVWPFASGDHPGVLGPVAQVDEVGELDHPRAITSRAVSFDCRDPVLFLGQT